MHFFDVGCRNLERRFVGLGDINHVIEDLLKKLEEKNKGKVAPWNLGLKLLDGKQPFLLNPKPRSDIRRMICGATIKNFNKMEGGE